MRLSKPLALFSVLLLTGCVERHVEVPSQYPDDPSLSQQFVTTSHEPSNVEVPYEQTHHGRAKEQVASVKHRATPPHPTYRAEPIDPGSNVPMDPPQPDELDAY